MANSVINIEDGQEFYFYFDTNQSYLTKNEVTTALNSLNSILSNVSKEFPELGSIEFIVLPSENGSFKLLGKLLIGGTFFVAGSIADDVVDIFIQRMLGKPKIYYVEKGVEFAIDLAKEIVLKPIEELNQIIPEEINLDKAIIGKSNLYEEISKNDNIYGINFNNEKENIIKKSDFAYHITETIRRDLDSVHQYLKVEIHKAVLTKTSNKKRNKKWTLITKNDEYIDCEIFDADFNKKFHKGQFPLKESSTSDIIHCKVETERELVNGEEKIIGHYITAIYLFNNIVLAQKPSDYNESNGIYKIDKESKLIAKKIKKTKKINEPDKNQISLFDDF